MQPEYVSERLDKLIAEGEMVLRNYDKIGNIDSHDLWFTEIKNFLSVNAPQFLEKLHSVAPKYREQLWQDPRGRAAYNLIQEQLEVVKLARASLSGAVSKIVGPNPDRLEREGLLDAVEMKPGMFGFSIDLKAVFKRLRQFWLSRRGKRHT